MMMMTGFSAIPSNALRAMPRKTSVAEAEAVEEKEEITEPKTANSTSVNTPPPATGKNIALPVGLGAGAALAGGIGAGQGFWEYAPNTGTMSEADALAKVKEDSTLKTAAEKELASLKGKKIDEIIESQLKHNTKLWTLQNPSASDDEKKTFIEANKTDLKDTLGTTIDPDTISQTKKYFVNNETQFKATLNTLEEELKIETDPSTKDYLIKAIAWTKEEDIPQANNMLKYFETCEKLDLKDTPTVQKLTKESLKTATQKVEGFMKWGYAKAEDLKSIGGEELVKHANSSKIALGAGALVAGAGAGTLAYFLLNKPKSTTAKPSVE